MAGVAVATTSAVVVAVVVGLVSLSYFIALVISRITLKSSISNSNRNRSELYSNSNSSSATAH